MLRLCVALKKKTSRPRSVRLVSVRLSGARNGLGAGMRLSSAAMPAKKVPQEARPNQVEGTSGQGDTVTRGEAKDIKSVAVPHTVNGVRLRRRSLTPVFW